MLSPKMLQALNDQLQAEYFSSYLYLAMAARCADLNLPGFAHWFRVQVQEENQHALKFFDYILLRRGTVELKGIEKPKGDWPDAPTVVEDALKHEQYITQRIHNLVKLAREENDPATEAFLQWFVTEQVEEEASVDGLVQQLKILGDSPSGLFIMDRELAKRQVGGAE
ncbi:MAG: ferritin [Thermogutta sp.]|nr:ferritin [Thermogutta sp.]